MKELNINITDGVEKELEYVLRDLPHKLRYKAIHKLISTKSRIEINISELSELNTLIYYWMNCDNFFKLNIYENGELVEISEDGFFVNEEPKIHKHFINTVEKINHIRLKNL